MSYYHCINCFKIPLISIDNEKITFECKKHEKNDITLDDYYKYCIAKCANGDDNYPKYFCNRNFYCFSCMNSLNIKNLNSYDYIKFFFFCQSHHEYNNNNFCIDCNQNKCNKCKENDTENHRYIPNNYFNNKNAILRNFINTAENKIKEVEKLLKQMKLILNIYKSLLFDKNGIVNRETIMNIENLNIIKDIQYFKDKINLILKELENSKDLEILNKNSLNNNAVPNNIKEKKATKIARENYSVKLRMKEIQNNENIKEKFLKTKGVDINNEVENNNNRLNNIYIYKVKKDNNKQIIIHRKADNDNKNNNNQMGNNGCLSNYCVNQKCTKVIQIDNNNTNIKKVEINKRMNIDSLFITPKNKLYEKYAIKLEDIDNNCHYIINKIIEISQNIEDEIDDNIKNKFLFSVGNIARIAHNYSNELAKILVREFQKENEFSSIIYEKAKIELSSWVNQSLIKENSNKEMKYLRKFYEYYSNEEKSRINRYILSDERANSILNQNNFNFYNLFRDLSQLYTEALIYSEKDIILQYAEENTDFDHNKMIDAAELNGRRFVKFTILPGLFVCKYCIKNGKILVLCVKKLENNNYNPFSDNIPINKELSLGKTIKKKDIASKLSCNIDYEIENNNYLIFINTNPIIPENDYPKYSINIFEPKTKKSKEIQHADKPKFSIIQKHYIYKYIYGTVEINGQIINSDKILLKRIKK